MNDIYNPSLKIISRPIEWYAASIADTSRPFSFMRWGDGEVGHMLGMMQGADCNGHEYFPELREALREVLVIRLMNPGKYPYYLLMQDLAMQMFGREITELVNRYDFYGCEWLDSTVIKDAMISGGLAGLIGALRTRDIIYVGPEFLKGNLPFPVQLWVNVPETNCWQHVDEIVDSLLRASEWKTLDRPIAMLSCGMAAKIVLHQCYGRLTRLGGGIIDAGSMWDPFAGRNTRGFHSSLGDIRTHYESISKCRWW